ncbi:MAG: dTDP-glucose 4,6-dehydratase [Clostridiales Family XIII bacterium]|jgi:dTDP-glucose 4,6-dehydratase|nr:dTDP-glucose 4,6-dehydratase [Clostridiales Family XIII bacterium]
MKLLVTGAAGFIGANYVYYELAEHPSVEIVGLDALTYAGNLATLDAAVNPATPDAAVNPAAPDAASQDSRFRFVKADITDRDAVEEIFAAERFDAVVNFAAESHVDRSIEDPSVFLMTNIIGTQILMDASRAYDVKRFHQVSTDEVYGDLPLDRPDLMFTEETPINTSSPYAASKAAADLLVQSYCRTHGFPATISRCSNNYGPYQFPEKLIPLMIANALADKPLPVYGEGLNVRDWLYAEDHCVAIDKILRDGRIGEVYNVGGHNEMRNIDIVKIILEKLGKPESLITFVTDRKGHDLRYAIDPSKISNELGWSPATNFAEGIKKTIDWYLANKPWWEQIISGEYQDYYKKMYGNR